MARGRRVSRGTAAPRRRKIWTRRLIQSSALAAAAEGHSQLLSEFEADYGAQLIGVTVARIRAQLWVQGTAPNGLLYGIRVATTDNVATLAGFGPGTTPDADWMTWGLGTLEDSGVSVIDLDVRSMRKIDELRQTLVLSVENAGASALTWGGAVSVLVMLP